MSLKITGDVCEVQCFDDEKVKRLKPHDYLPKKEKSLDYWVQRIKSLGYNVNLQVETA
ncbi:hypothetical protein [Brevibacillus choshinensis]|uniref:hypothetical protein n=1 Tax=Brevibacillus choshinensis TaxID=54911 RepID=UPI000AAB49E6|nr:hypothetical protein [Brevibacillus choshinensis]